MTWPKPFALATVLTLPATPLVTGATTPEEYPSLRGVPAPVTTHEVADAHPTPYRYSVPLTTVVAPAWPLTSVPMMPCSVLFSPTATQLPTLVQSMPLTYHASGMVTAVPGCPLAIGTIDGL